MKKSVSKFFSIIFLIFILAVTFAFPFVCYADVYTDTSYGVAPDGWLGTGFTMNLPSGVESTSGKMVTNFGSVPYFLGRPLDYTYYYADTAISDYLSTSGRGFGTRYIDFKTVSSSDEWYNEPTDFSDVYVFYGANVHVNPRHPYSTWEDIYSIIGTDSLAHPNFLINVDGVGGPVPSFTYYGAIDKSRFYLDFENESTFDSLPKTFTLYQIMNATYDYNSITSGNDLLYTINLLGHTGELDILENGSTIRPYGFETGMTTTSFSSAVTISDVTVSDDKFAYALDKYYVDNNSAFRVRKVTFDMKTLVYDLMPRGASADIPSDELLYIRDFKLEIIPLHNDFSGNVEAAYNSINIRQFIDFYGSVPIVSLSLDYEGAFGDSYQHNIGDIGNSVIVVEGGGEGGEGGEIVATDFTGWIVNTLSTLFNTKLFGFFGLGDILFACLGIVLVFLLLKFFAGG